MLSENRSAFYLSRVVLEVQRNQLEVATRVIFQTFVIIILQGNPTNVCMMHMLVTFPKKIIVSVLENSTSR